MSSSPLVSILIPVYNAEQYIGQTLDCVFAQTYPNIEVIVVDDGSTDNSYCIAKQYESNQVKVLHQNNSGACCARNLAFEHCQGEYIQYLDGDDLLTNDKISSQIEYLQNCKDINAIATCPWRRFVSSLGDCPPEQQTVFKNYSSGIELLIDMLSGHGMMAVHSYLTPRKLIESAGPWNNSLKMNQDGEFFARVLLQSGELCFSPTPTAWYRSGLQNSISGRLSSTKCQSKLLALQEISRQIRNVEDSSRVRSALSYAFSHLAYISNLISDSTREEAFIEIQKLGIRGFLEKPRLMAIASHIFGLRNSLKMRRLMTFIKGN